MILENSLKTGNMIRMFMGNKNSLNIIVTASDTAQRLSGFFNTCTGIYQYRSAVIFNKCTVGTAPAIKRTYSDHVVENAPFQ